MRHFTFRDTMDHNPRRCTCCDQDRFDAPGPYLDVGDIGSNHFPQRVYFCQNGLRALAEAAGWPNPAHHRRTETMKKKAEAKNAELADQLAASRVREEALMALLVGPGAETTPEVVEQAQKVHSEDFIDLSKGAE